MGGKQRLVKHLLPLIPEHHAYCEVFGGSAALLLNKPRSPIEVYNDIDGDLVNLFMVVRDRPDEFAKRLDWVPYSRELYESWRKPFLAGNFDDPKDPVERAVRFYYIIRTAFFSHPAKGWRFERTSPRVKHTQEVWAGLRRLEEITQRLKSVYVDRVDFRRCIKNWDSTDTFFYADPPYLGATPYLYTFTDQDHEDLAKLLAKTQGKWLLTYNDTARIRRLYARYHVQRVRQVLAHDKVAAGQKHRLWTQLLIRNYELPKRVTCE